MHATNARMQDLLEFSLMKRADVVAKQLVELAARHGMTVDELGQRWLRSGGDRVTFHRIANAVAKTEPKAENLRRIAALVGETRDLAFPETESESTRPDPVTVPTDPGIEATFALKNLREAPPDLQREVENFLKYANRRAADEATSRTAANDTDDSDLPARRRRKRINAESVGRVPSGRDDESSGLPPPRIQPRPVHDQSHRTKR
jgi:hypothetical protein